MAGSLVIPNIIANEPGPTAQVSKLDTNWTAIQTYVNAREIAFGTFAARPAAGTAGRWYFATDTGTLYADTGAAWTQVALGTLASNLGETLTGLGLANNAVDAVNDLDIAVGACSSGDAVIASRIIMSLTTGLTKQLDVAWAVGNNQGGRMSAAAIADTTYHVFVIERTDTGVVDVGFDVSATAPTLPANYTKSRRIGSIIRAGGTILGFSQDGDNFLLNTPVLDVNAVNPGLAAVTRTLASIPTGVVVQALLDVWLDATTSGADSFFVYLSALAAADLAPSATLAPLATLKMSGAGNGWTAGGQARVRTNTLAQIRSRCGTASGAADVLRLVTLGWDDRRGRG